MSQGSATDFETHRPALKGLAYRMLGTVSDAEDVVQEAYLRWHGMDTRGVDSPGTYLSTIVSRLCLDRWKEARHQRETYVGPWLPEPVVHESDGPDAVNDLAHDVSFALMLALERLSPLERAAFLLHDVFEMDFREVAIALDRSESACRQLAKRARHHVQAARPRFEADPDQGERLAEAFFTASRSGDTGTLRAVLAEHVVLHTDGGGIRSAALRLIYGSDRISRFFAGLARKKVYPPRWSRRVTLNGLPGILTLEADGILQATSVALHDGRITNIYVIRNPNKLDHLTHLAPDSMRNALQTDNGRSPA
ncbi:RNA polymerase sigma-70 factor [Marinobacter halodurans]|uniref:RNA polymerase sigma-70 factor n=1 Tax=Marinobacter halodurans TaxID=2528979 RepID=A0ABY1ZJI0_9GAMM|nr:sigma-70 family RNA polymerase sigma factor [Marinobacter halodurans]TBW55165.1 RNA polymerase sigma-70 factor [Marinobacter halodurans]